MHAPTAVRDAIERAERDRSDAAVTRGASVQELAEVTTLMATADQLDRAAEDRNHAADGNSVEESANGLSRDELEGQAAAQHADGTVAYDSADRRAAWSAKRIRSASHCS